MGFVDAIVDILTQHKFEDVNVIDNRERTRKKELDNTRIHYTL